MTKAYIRKLVAQKKLDAIMHPGFKAFLISPTSWGAFVANYDENAKSPGRPKRSSGEESEVVEKFHLKSRGQLISTYPSLEQAKFSKKIKILRGDRAWYLAGSGNWELNGTEFEIEIEKL